ncbi:hypothetical protein EMPS_03257 [Entomortierella parvispora]|uniref:Extracellular membrane protein CFEM domain-containing protein n=1 Tax=Entomortierella parvispora TaxID=205924 RepID=A0A9P3H718_9FUNG|nr:hypothetical protein EMPS_03257 [Entomortierella parvispora]
MRSQAILVLAAIALATSASAQTNTTVLACETCLVNAAKSSFPVCSSIASDPTITATDPSQLTGNDKDCYCSMVSSTSWVTGCVSPTSCPQDMLTELTQEFADAKNTYCAGFSVSSSKNEASASLSALTFTAVGVAAAIINTMVFL